ncbi:envelope integrity protein Cei [Mycobacterium conspicuum]|uniref:Uncharacterized protein n=1 Tax=Mycobacterium conspicuum TaxID=44010 RepID=A0A1X1ST03_9MYCO|nr:envelope integrity protein Cei [Mycobacterium conspicuum]ORV33866.1 hypothetical protein AWC00_26205 [Mycobacterium conspicuum]BBZ38668.1 hypothetical protein MCNS_17310 [Mycobacterium conspicuum]
MVALITEGTAFDKHGRPFRRRNPRPAIIVLVFLLVATAMAWTVALTRPNKARQAETCNPPPQAAQTTGSAATQLGEPASRSEMMDVTPAKLSDTKIHVLNASGRGGQAADVAGALKDLGFAQPTAANDPIYATTRLTCQGQIRFGTAGAATAAAVWLVAPCAELFHDSRADDSVDLAIGTDFGALAHSDDIDAVLATLRPGANEPSDPTLLSKVHSSSC